MQQFDITDTTRAKISAMKAAGKTVEEIAASFSNGKVVPGLGYGGEAVKVGQTTYYL